MTTIVSRGVKIVADRNGNLPSFLVSLKQRRSKTTFLYENKCRENSQGNTKILVKILWEKCKLTCCV
ncbi:hypothetical protein ACROYT_G033944 [Oculina patagonica]